MTPAIDVLELLARRSEPTPAAEIARLLGLPRRSLAALLERLEARRYVRRERGGLGEGYRLGHQVLSLAGAVLSHDALVRAARPAIAALMLRSGATAGLLVRCGEEVVALEKVAADHRAPPRVRLGQRVPLSTSAAGKAILAFAPAQEREAFLARGALPRLTRHSITVAAALRCELEEVARTGLAWSRGEMFEGIAALARPVLGAGGVAVAGVSVGLPTSALDAARAEAVAAALAEAVAEIAARLREV